MRVLAIRGCNLASLGGEFALDFESGPLAGAGLFAITGPTGAGKSTLLDALCLALFDRTPRLAEGGAVRVGRADEEEARRLPAGDVRSVLRRGEAQGWAEVDFVGVDGRRYRARWAARRARNRPGGRLQRQQVSLVDLDTGQVLGGAGKTETLEAIRERLGLTFDQFRRSVLLAQGEFAAFLRASEGERGELLERVTGTQIYGEISMAAFARAKEERAELERLEAEAARIEILPPEERAAREEALGAVARALEGLRERRERARGAVAWYERLRALEGAVAEAEEALAAAEAAWAGAEPLRQELAEVAEAARHRGLLEEADRARSEHDAARRALAVAEEEAARAGEERAMAGDLVEAAAAAQQAAEEALRRAGPDLERAAALDERVRAAREHLERARSERGAAEEALARAVRAEQEIREHLERAAAEAAEAEAWLREHEPLRALAEGWVRWEPELERYAGARAGLDEVQAALEKAREGRTRASEALAAARSEAARAAEALEAVEERRRRAEERAARVPLAGIRERRSRAEDLRDRLRELREVALRAGESRRAGEEAEAEGAEARRDLGEAEAGLERAAREKDRVAAARSEAALALRRTREALDLEDRRAELRPGEPCPLCGSTEHPWAAEGGPGLDLAEAQEARVRELEAEAGRLEGLVGELRARCEALQERIEACAARSEAAAGELGALGRRWDELREGCPGVALPDGPADPGAAGAVARALGEAEEALRAAERAGAEAEKALEEAGEARRAEDRAREAAGRAADAAALREGALREAEEALRALEQEAGGLEAELERIRRDLAEALGPGDGWQRELHRDPVGFRARCGADVAEWQARSLRRERARGEIAELGARREAAASVTGERREQAARLAREQAAREQALGALEAERGRLLGGRPTAEVRQELEQAVEAARERGEAARRALGRAETALAAARARLEAARTACGAAADRAGRAAEALHQALAARGMALERVRELLARDEAWVEAQQARVESLGGALHRARTVLDERSRQLREHRAGSPPEAAEAEARAALESADQEAERLEEERYRLRSALDRDDRARREHEAVLGRIEAQRSRAGVWQTVSDLIGSHDGKKFRTFAQSLTLDVLLTHANRHLEDLAPRYRLERVPGYDLALQVVDRYMADEVRSVNSLSGGESFLVSLALALGLSSLSSRQVRVESLFVDEGFGSLDPETLDVVLETLDALQASGRRIGVISHVPGLAERIGTRVEVRPDGGGLSRVRVVGVG